MRRREMRLALTRSTRQRGFTLIEVLVAVLLLAVGVIGAAGAQLAALRTRHGSALMSDGVQLASSLAERMRANTAQMQRAGGANPYLHLRYDAADGVPPSPPVQCHAVACTSEQLAHFDAYEVALALHAGFPGGRVAVCRDEAIWDGGRGKLSWDCAGSERSPIVVKLGWHPARGAAPTGASAAPASPSIAIVVNEVAP